MNFHELDNRLETIEVNGPYAASKLKDVVKADGEAIDFHDAFHAQRRQVLPDSSSAGLPFNLMNRQIALEPFNQKVWACVAFLLQRERVKLADILTYAGTVSPEFLVTQSVDSQVDYDDDQVSEAVDVVLSQFADEMLAQGPTLPAELQAKIDVAVEMIHGPVGEMEPEDADEERVSFFKDQIASRIKIKYLPALYRLFGAEPSAEVLAKRSAFFDMEEAKHRRIQSPEKE